MMHALAARDIIELWETAQHHHPVDRALALLTAAEPQHPRDELAALPLGERDRRLLALRALSFGDRLSGHSACPRCNERGEFDLSCRVLQSPAVASSCERMTHMENYSLRVRALNSFDLAAAADACDVAEARRILSQRCLVEARCNDEPVEVDALPAAVSDHIAEAALAADPQAEWLLDLTCPACAHRWQSLLDIVHIIWTEISARAQRLLSEVHLLARAYGWHEDDILAMHPRTPRRLSATGVVVNFLTRLAQRNLGIANLVHPRLPSTFEPVNEGANMLSAVEEVPLASPPDLPSLVRSSPASGHAEQSTRSHAQTIRKEGEHARGATRAR